MSEEPLSSTKPASFAGLPLVPVPSSMSMSSIVVFVSEFVFVAAFIVWSLMKATMGIRLSKEAELKGTDVSETGVIAYSIRD